MREREARFPWPAACVAVTVTLTPRTSGAPGNSPTKQPFCEPPPGFVHIEFLQEFNLHAFVIKERKREKKRLYTVINTHLDKHIC